ncbi:MAG: 2-C-methyl-D-erythritol 4-phosphate cytidylyltransferase [Candidatus Aquicultor primus]|uniref:2-C-methyl-D-erythritol 4-phosphate cytidylyltransferase n=1 Tax=Candidatus Aquicultor primus TaxID=1797195 RepID=A0A1F2UG38_9ACTN|nr:MAG: 2-C-methyl-D-erythritol 4-phosphate cytidylyltransferase [Candidatus Aquicultor primus]HCG98306.1 2-C-methyl-D-erythritol 4-phosphate cytidylyltransferase [Actinomycetota bacterium]
MNLALVVAAGKGRRMGTEGGKQFLELAGRPVIAHTLAAFEEATSIDAIVVVAAEENLQKCLEVIALYGIIKVERVVAGGDERQDSVYNGLLAAAEFEGVDLVAVHDGARPLVTPRIIDEAIGAAGDCDGAVVGVSAKDTVKLVRDGYIAETLPRDLTWQIQTPQVFRYKLLVEAHQSARREGFNGTDDAVLVERVGGRIKVVMGSDENIKITTPSDLVFAEALLKERSAKSDRD